MTTISPGSTSRTYSASRRSRAQVSRGDDARRRSSRPIDERPEALGVARGRRAASGRQERRASRRPATLPERSPRARPRAVSRVRPGQEVQDRPRCRRWTGRSSPPPRAPRAGCAALTRLPLCAIAIGPAVVRRLRTAGRFARRSRPRSSSARGRSARSPGQARRAPARAKTSATSPMPFSTRSRCAVGGDDARRLLPPVLQRVEPEVGEVGGLGVAEDAEERRTRRGSGRRRGPGDGEAAAQAPRDRSSRGC